MSFQQKTKNIFLILFYLVKHPRKFYAALSVRGKKWALRGLILLLIILIAVPTTFWYQAKNAKAAWWNEGWMYRQKIQLSNSTGADLTDFQVSTTVDTASLITAGKMQATTCADMRFTDSKGQPLDYWIEENNPGCNNAATKVWLKAPKVYSGTNATSIYMYYGNPSATATQDGDKVFEFFDDFNGSSIDTGKWNPNSQPYTVSDGQLKLTDVGANWNAALQSKKSFSSSYVVETRTYTTGNTGYWYISNDQNAPAGGSRRIDISSSGGTSSWRTNTSDALVSSGISFPLSQWNIVKFERKSASSWDVKVNSNNYSFTDVYNFPNTYITLLRWDSAPEIDFDYSFARKYASAEPTASASAEEKGPGPVAYWRFDEGQGGTAQDATTNNNDGTLGTAPANPTWKPESDCVAGKCLDFDGSDDLVSAIDGASLDQTGAMTVQAWVKLDSLTAGTRIPLLSKYYAAGGQRGYMFELQSTSAATGCNNLPAFTLSSTGPTFTGGTRCGSTALQKNKWYHVAAVFDPNTTMKIYINGADNSGSMGTGSIPSGIFNNDRNLLVGAADDFSTKMDGKIDEPKIYPYARTPQQILADYAAGQAAASTNEGTSVSIGESPKWMTDGLVGHWKMDESSGTIVADASGNANTGTLTNAQETGTAEAASTTTAVYDADNAALSATNDAYNNMILRVTGGGGCGVATDTERTITDYDGAGKYFTVSAFSAEADSCTFEVRHQTGGKFGNGVGFDGNNDTVIATNSSSLQPTSQMTVSAWVKKKIGYYGGGAVIRNNNQYFLDFSDNATTLRFGINGQWSMVNSGYPDDGAWHFITGIYDGTHTYRYVDGKLLGKTAYSGAIGTGGGWPLRIGAIPDLSSFFPGNIDDARIYNRALSPDEVKQLSEWGPGPVGHWKMDEGNGGTAYDSSGNGNNGNITGATWANGKYGNALNYDGTVDTVSVADNAAVLDSKSLQGLTLESWIKTTDSSGSYHLIAGKGGYGTSSRYSMFYYGSDGSIKCVFGDNQGGYESVTSTGFDVRDGNWHHVVFVADKQQLTKKIYIDGVQNISQALSAVGSYERSANLYIGEGDTFVTIGSLDDVRVYNYARTLVQIQQDMDGGIAAAESGGGPLPDPVAHWKMDEGQGDTVYDSSTNNNDGTLDPQADGGNQTTAAMWDNGGKFGKAMEFDGTDDYINLTSLGGLTKNKEQITLSYWVNLHSLPTVGKHFIPFIETNSNSGYTKFSSVIYDNGSVAFGWRDSATGTTYNITSDPSLISTGQWYHITGVVDTVNDVQYIFVNGQLKKTASNVSGSIYNDAPAYAAFSGRPSAWATTLYLDGFLDEVKIYNSALTPEQIKLDMNGGKALQLGGQTSATGAMGQSAEYCVPGDATSCAGPVGEWKFDEKTGGTANDTSGSGNNGTLTNSPTWTRGNYGSGIYFQGDSTDSCVYLGSPAALQFQSDNQITINAWVKLNSAISGGSYGSIYDSLDDSWSSGGVRLYIDSSNRLAAYSRTNNFYENASFPVGSWQFVTLKVIEGTGAYLYRNGVLVASGSAGDIYSNSSTFIRIGDRAGFSADACTASAAHFPGIVDHVQVYNYARTPAQIAWDYNRGKPVGWWKMDEGEGDKAYDSSGNGNTGTLTSMDPPNDWVDGKFGKALDFDADNDNILVNENNVLDPQDISVSAWVKLAGDTPNNYQRIVHKTSGGAGYEFWIQNDGRINVRLNADNDENYLTSTSLKVADDVWTHVAFTYSNETLKIYANDQSETFSNSGYGAVNNSSGNLYIGNRVGADRPLNGLLDDVRIYNYPLTVEQLRQVMNEGSAIRFGDQ